MQSINNENNCSKCKVPYKYDLQESKAASFKVTCPKCNFQKFKCYCPKCNTAIESQDPNRFSDGFRIECPSTSCKNVFQVVKCPHPDCMKFNFYNNGNYSMGDLTKCKDCKTAFQQLTCPHCFESNYWKGDLDNFYASGNTTSCYACQKSFQHLICPHCKNSKYFLDGEYTCGIKQSCDSCKKNFQHVLCISCYHPNYYTLCGFKYGTPQTCSNPQCKQKFELVICPDCGKENFIKDPKIDVHRSFKDFDCWSCKSKFTHYSCKNCHEQIYLSNQEFRNGVNKFSCPSCKKPLDTFYKCETCSKVTTNNTNCPTCPKPKPIPIPVNNQFPLFGSNTANFSSSLFSNLSSNSNSNNSKPHIYSSIIQPKNTQKDAGNTAKNSKMIEEKEKEVPQNIEDGKHCVICLDQPAKIAFVPCGHKKTCVKCSETLMKGKKACPICRKTITTMLPIYD